MRTPIWDARNLGPSNSKAAGADKTSESKRVPFGRCADLLCHARRLQPMGDDQLIRQAPMPHLEMLGRLRMAGGGWPWASGGEQDKPLPGEDWPVLGDDDLFQSLLGIGFPPPALPLASEPLSLFCKARGPRRKRNMHNADICAKASSSRLHDRGSGITEQERISKIIKSCKQKPTRKPHLLAVSVQSSPRILVSRGTAHADCREPQTPCSARCGNLACREVRTWLESAIGARRCATFPSQSFPHTIDSNRDEAPVQLMIRRFQLSRSRGKMQTHLRSVTECGDGR